MSLLHVSKFVAKNGFFFSQINNISKSSPVGNAQRLINCNNNNNVYNTRLFSCFTVKHKAACLSSSSFLFSKSHLNRVSNFASNFVVIVIDSDFHNFI
jgi:hypothetical protein